jgi:soluble lytic murein transglycosylase-like protein
MQLRLALFGVALLMQEPAIAESGAAPTGREAGTPSTQSENHEPQEVPAAPVFPLPAIREIGPDDLPPPNIFAVHAAPRGGSFAISTSQGPSDKGSGYWAIVKREAQAADIPLDLIDAVMSVESGYNAGAIGADGEVGLMQVMPGTARMLGFAGTTAELATPESNIRYGAMYLAGAWRLAEQDICTTVMKYRAGHGETRFSVRSVDYCLKVRARLAARGFRVTGSVPVPNFGQFAGSGSQGRLRSGRGRNALDFSALNARLRQLIERVAFQKIR